MSILESLLLSNARLDRVIKKLNELSKESQKLDKK
jgi:hypothetical protein